VYKKYETLWLHKQGKPWEKPPQKRKSPGQICVSPAEKTATQNGAGATPDKKHHKSMGIASDTMG